MFHLNLDARRPREALGEALGHVHGPVVSAVATERHLQVVASIHKKCVNRLAHKRLGCVKEAVDLRLVLLKEFDDRLVEPRKALQGRNAVRIRLRPTVEHEPTPVVVVRIVRYPSRIGKRNNR